MANYTSEEKVLLSGLLLVVKQFGEALDDAVEASKKVLAGESGDAEFKKFLDKVVECTGNHALEEIKFDTRDVIFEDIDFLEKMKSACEAGKICIEKRLA